MPRRGLPLPPGGCPGDPVDSGLAADGSCRPGLEGSRAFDGKGDSRQSNQLTGSITVTVVERLPNGNLVVSGEKNLELGQGSERVRLSGLVRPEDINRYNQVSSQSIADARISYAGKGVLNDSNSAGWLTRFFTSPWFPF